MASIVRSKNGLKSPYSRIIFGLSLSDILQSVALLISPFAVPSDTSDLLSPFSWGTIQTCEAAGFFLMIGGTVIPFYTVFLSYYFLKRVKDKVSVLDFARKYEFKIHALIWILPIIGGIVGLVRKDFNPLKYGSMCSMMDRPVGCSIDPDTPCIRGQDAPKDVIFIFVIPMVSAFLMLILNLLRLTVYVHSEERLMRLVATRQAAEDDEYRGTSFWDKFKASASICCRGTRNHQSSTDTNQHQSLAMQSLVQSALYIVAYLVSYSCIMYGFIQEALGEPRSSWVLWALMSIFWPLGGLFNILIYTRPKVAVTRTEHPEHAHSSWFVIVLFVIFSGGEVPTEINFAEESSSGEEEGEGHSISGCDGIVMAATTSAMLFPIAVPQNRRESEEIVSSWTDSRFERESSDSSMA